MSASVAHTPEPETFELGLIAAGAVSAGAYTAGVLDMLFEALDAFEAARLAGDPEAPTHKIKLRAMVGASAGAMNAAIVAAWADRGFAPLPAASIDSAAARRRNPLAWAWIDQPHITRLLDTGDMAGGRMPSVLNGEWLGTTVNEVLSPSGGEDGLDPPAATRQREWLRDLRVRLTVGNLTGTPFELTFDTSGQRAGGMMDHAEVMDFRAVRGDQAVPDHYLDLPAGASRDDKDWAALGQAALASGAFPAALPSRLLNRAFEKRAPRNAFVPKGDPQKPDAGGWEKLPAPKPMPPDAMLCVDGGIANNEPIELCREALLLRTGGRLERDPAKANSSMIMIDPFPDGATLGPTDPATKLPKLLAALISAFKNQARYRPIDLLLAVQGGAFSRQLLAPSANNHPAGAPALAGGPLGGFFGFFHEEFRKHDFLLGRHNCRSFLRKHFVVPAANPVVSGWALQGDALSPLAQAVRAAHGLAEEAVAKQAKIPLVWLAPALRDAEAAPQPAWPAGHFDPASLDRSMVDRAKLLIRALAEGRGFMVETGAKLLGGFLARRAAGKAREALKQARDQARL